MGNQDVKPEDQAEYYKLAEELGRMVLDDKNYTLGKGKNKRMPMYVGRQAEIIKRMKELERIGREGNANAQKPMSELRCHPR